LPTDQLTDALRAMMAVGDEVQRVNALISLASRVPDTDRATVLSGAIATTRAIYSSYDRGEAISELVPHLLPEHIKDAFQIINSIRIPSVREKILKIMQVDTSLAAANSVPPQQVTLIKEPFDRLPTMQAKGFVNDTNKEHEPTQSMLFDESSDSFKWSVTKVKSSTDKSGADKGDRLRLKRLLAHPNPLFPTKIAEALSITKMLKQTNKEDVSSIDRLRAETIERVATQLPSELMQEALSIVKMISTNVYRVNSLAALIPHLRTNQVHEAVMLAKSPSMIVELIRHPNMRYRSTLMRMLPLVIEFIDGVDLPVVTKSIKDAVDWFP